MIELHHNKTENKDQHKHDPYNWLLLYCKIMRQQLDKKSISKQNTFISLRQSVSTNKMAE